MALLERLQHFFSPPVADAAVASLYRSSVAQAREPAFYSQFDVPDTVDGRFDLLLLHVYLVMHRLGAAREIKQQLFDLMFADMERSLREMGVGDMSIGKKMKPMLAAFYGRAQGYDRALASGDADLREALGRNLYATQKETEAVPTQPADDKLNGLVAYVHAVIASLETQPVEDLVSGRVKFPSLPVSA